MAALISPVKNLIATPNLGVVDCLVRIAIGLVLTALAVGDSIGAWGFVGLYGLVTGTLWVCPVYVVLGISTLQSPYET